MKKFLKKAVVFLLYYAGASFISREIINRGKMTAILYHDIRPELFQKHVMALRKRYNIVSFEDYLASRSRNTPLPPKSLVITFDDGHKGNYLLREIFIKHDVRPVVFLCAGIVNTGRHFWFKENMSVPELKRMKRMDNRERLHLLREKGFDENKEFSDRQALSEKEIAALRETVDFQSHGTNHAILPRCSTEESKEEIEGSKKILEGSFGMNIHTFSFPNGDYSERDIQLLKKSGYRCAFTLDYGFNTPATDLYRLKRFCIDDTDDTRTMLLKAAGAWLFLSRY